MDAFPNTKTIFALQSATFAAIGILAIWGWSYATKNRRLIGDELGDEEIERIHTKILPEPLTALVTIPFSFVSPIAWNLSWLAMPLISRIVIRRRTRKPTE